MLKPVFELCYFTRKTSVESSFQNSQGSLFITGWLYGYHFWSILRPLILLSKNRNFATLVNTKQKL